MSACGLGTSFEIRIFRDVYGAGFTGRFLRLSSARRYSGTSGVSVD
jgi:hypothetical protein